MHVLSKDLAVSVRHVYDHLAECGRVTTSVVGHLEGQYEAAYRRYRVQLKSCFFSVPYLELYHDEYLQCKPESPHRSDFTFLSVSMEASIYS